ncbi:MAG: type 2 isopentenyl-diphosphate Delta-isomerase [Candidatus Micrarchaeia archaeon]
MEKRKLDHISISIKQNVSYSTISAGFDDVVIPHDSLPEISLEQVDSGIHFLKKDISAPIMIDAITGGFKGAEKINQCLAEAAEKEGIIFALGSQRAMIENPDLAYTYKVRKVAPTIPIIGNIGIANVNKQVISRLDSALKEVDADALAIHLNPLQEAIQSDGDLDFRGKLEIINEVCDSIDIPVIIKEVGHGMSEETLKKIEKTKAEFINVAGAGGTSWTKIENLRNQEGVKSFNEDGVPTVVSLINAKRLTKKRIIASGGIRSGIDVAKSLCLGAEVGGAALPFLKAYKENRVQSLIKSWKHELKVFMFTRGICRISDLKKLKPKIIGKTKDLL